MTGMPGSSTELALVLGTRFDSRRLKDIGNSSKAKETFATEFEYVIRQLIRQKFLKCANRIIDLLNDLEHDLVLESVDDDITLCVRYSRFSSDLGQSRSEEFTVCFSLDTVVFFVDTIFSSCEDAPVATEEGDTIVDLYSAFSRSTLEGLSSDLPLLKQRCEDLQTVLENDTCERIRSDVVLFADALNLLGHHLNCLDSDTPEIDYQDPVSGLHFGTTCIATVISKHLMSPDLE